MSATKSRRRRIGYVSLAGLSVTTALGVALATNTFGAGPTMTATAPTRTAAAVSSGS
jgi:ABC-type transporter Mla subunit MlaD